jgi:SAM-dependent methyltransferase
MFGRLIQSFTPTIGAANEPNREKWLENILQSVPAESRILDAGAGTQRYRAFCRHLKYVSQDFAQYSGEGDGAALQTGTFDYGTLDITSDITSIPEPDASFDAIMCIEVLEHLPSPADALREFARLLRPGGLLIMTAPFCSLSHFTPYHFSTGFNKYWYEYHLAECGFDIAEITANGNYFEYIAQEVNRVPGVAMQYAAGTTSKMERLCLLVLQRMLARFSRTDRKSSELLCFGYHVFARRK